MTEPRVILLDEPLSALDAHLGVRMQALLRSPAARTRHHLHLRHAQPGRGVLRGRPGGRDEPGQGRADRRSQEIYRQPANRFVADFIGNVNIFRGVAETVAGGVATIRTPVGLMSALNTRSSLRIGEEVDFFVNADQIQVGATARGSNHVSGQAAELQVVGNMVTLYLELAAGLELKVSIPEPTGDRLSVKIGDMVSASWQNDAAHVFAKNG